MRACVYGAGAIGGHLAVRLAKGGADVSVIARGPHLAAIQANGLEVHAIDGMHKIKVQATDDPRTVGPVDAVFVTVKAPALPAVAAGIGRLLKPDTAVAFVMNGIPWWYFLHLGGPFDGRKLPRVDPDDVLLKIVGPERAVGGVVYSASAVIDPGVIEVEQPKSRVVLGEPNGTLSPRVAEMAETITKGGISGEATTEIRTEIWNKLIGNLAGGTLAVLSGMAPKSVYTQPAAKEAALRAMHEAASIAQALGARPTSNHEGRVASQGAMDHKPSILQDLELGRPMEVDGLFDAPLVLARIAGVATPTLDLLVALCKLRAEASGLYRS
jgi:2-dehydropantoate 2-reductase